MAEPKQDSSMSAAQAAKLVFRPPVELDGKPVLPEAIEGARWFYDETHDNIFSAFEIGEADRIGKAVVHLNYTRKKVAYNALITTGVVQRQNLKEAGYREIGKGLKP